MGDLFRLDGFEDFFGDAGVELDLHGHGVLGLGLIARPKPHLQGLIAAAQVTANSQETRLDGYGLHRCAPWPLMTPWAAPQASLILSVRPMPMAPSWGM